MVPSACECYSRHTPAIIDWSYAMSCFCDAMTLSAKANAYRWQSDYTSSTPEQNHSALTSIPLRERFSTCLLNFSLFLLVVL